MYHKSYIIYHISYINIYILYHILYHISIYQSIYQSANISIYQSKHLPLMAAGCWVNCGLPEPVWLRGRIGHEILRFLGSLVFLCWSIHVKSTPCHIISDRFITYWDVLYLENWSKCSFHTASISCVVAIVAFLTLQEKKSPATCVSRCAWRCEPL